MIRAMLLVLCLGCATAQRSGDLPPPSEPNGAELAKADNCAGMSDHGIGCAIGMAIEQAQKNRR